VGAGTSPAPATPATLFEKVPLRDVFTYPRSHEKGQAEVLSLTPEMKRHRISPKA